ncbi:hypothetical protein [Pseudomonas luteola]|uniref:hypothetical protein n=1 Tax=Pseudomonas luteola TaxID=47886 RepID=UPI0015E29FB5|nr:hypothetical protein [Pseudomonas zeshuii]MBA1250361.1 hypothetical protein [Pseudomonas zeshuii]
MVDIDISSALLYLQSLAGLSTKVIDMSSMASASGRSFVEMCQAKAVNRQRTVHAVRLSSPERIAATAAGIKGALLGEGEVIKPRRRVAPPAFMQ